MKRSAERRPPVEVDALGPETLVTRLVQQHLERLADYGRSPATLATYEFAAAKLKKFIGGLRVREASTVAPGRCAAVDAHRSRGDKGQASKTILRGGLQLAVMASVLNANPVRDVQPLRAKRHPKGATALGAERARAHCSSDWAPRRSAVNTIWWTPSRC